jgi:hypothetical protein
MQQFPLQLRSSLALQTPFAVRRSAASAEPPPINVSQALKDPPLWIDFKRSDPPMQISLRHHQVGAGMLPVRLPVRLHFDTPSVFYV